MNNLLKAERQNKNPTTTHHKNKIKKHKKTPQTNNLGEVLYVVTKNPMLIFKQNINSKLNIYSQ